MTPRQRNSLSWLASLGACVFGYLLLAPTREAPAQDTIGTVVGIEPADVRTLTVARGSDSTTLTRTHALWVGDGTESADLDQEAISAWLTTAIDLKIEGPLDVRGVPFDASVEFIVTDGTSHTVGIGREVPTGEGSYINIGGAVYIASQPTLGRGFRQTQENLPSPDVSKARPAGSTNPSL